MGELSKQRYYLNRKQNYELGAMIATRSPGFMPALINAYAKF
jgi:hypothetical protein